MRKHRSRFYVGTATSRSPLPASRAATVRRSQPRADLAPGIHDRVLVFQAPLEGAALEECLHVARYSEPLEYCVGLLRELLDIGRPVADLRHHVVGGLIRDLRIDERQRLVII